MLFGASTPAAKPLLGNAAPQLIAGLLYIGAAAGLGLIKLNARRGRAEAPLKGSDWWWLAGATLFGGVVGPVLLMNGLMRTPAASTSLLLNVEAVATALIAWIVFREHASARTVAGMLLIVLGAVILGWNGTPAAGSIIGPLAIITACVAWGIDNNLTRNISAGDAVEIALVKTFVGGTVNTTLAFVLLHSQVPKATIVAGAGIVGFFGYGLSLVLYIVALRHLGTARTGAYFSTAPFIGAVIAVAVGSAVVDWRFFVSAALMGVGVLLHLTERHEHAHLHERTEHEHEHVHDVHHQHTHTAADPPGEPHTHRHVHETVVHSHEHFPDTHHRHSHE